MADNILVTPGSGATIAADDIASALHQRVKITVGADGVNDGDVSSANPMPVSAASLPLPTGASTSAAQTTGNSSLSSIDGKIPSSLTVTSTRLLVDGSGVTQPVSGTVTANAGTNLNTSLLALEAGGNLAAVAASASILDDWDESDRAKVNPIAGQAGVAGGAGAVSALTQRVVIATDQTLIPVAGDVAHDGVDSGNPIKTGGQARTTNPTAVADADRVNFIADKLGKHVVVMSIRELKVQQATTITASTAETTVLTAGAAGVFHDVYGVICANTSATATDVTFKDATAGTTRFNIYVPAGETRGFMLPESGAHNQASAANNWTATSSASITSLKISIFAVKNL